jgi:hypothetical protein
MADDNGQKSFFERAGETIAAVKDAVMSDGHIAAFARQGAKELGNAFGQMLPDHIAEREPGGIFSPTPGEIAESRRELPSPGEIARSEPAYQPEQDNGQEQGNSR